MDVDHHAPQPILLGLDGTGIRLTELSESTQYIDSGNSGLQHRTAWAGAGDGVLFFDPDGRDAITETRQYVFTEWDPGAASDLEALRSAFDSNGDGKLTSADAEFAKFKVLVTKADGGSEVKTLAQLNITEIDLGGDATRTLLPNGSMITGQDRDQSAAFLGDDHRRAPPAPRCDATRRTRVGMWQSPARISSIRRASVGRPQPSDRRMTRWHQRPTHGVDDSFRRKLRENSATDALNIASLTEV